MRKISYGIGLFSVVFLIIFGFYFSYHYTAMKESQVQPESMEAESIIRTGYHLGVRDGKIIVLLEDGSVYETTDIEKNTLPESVQKKIEEGYVLYSDQELYSFLENYSS
ncbi:MAG: hypothetical protein EOM40_02600 [Clostridia bacterium]|nr:hypothetical protein [Clostridia bacterium]NCC43162.1 hypothetical protein [Clostridia bacterium]